MAGQPGQPNMDLSKWGEEAALPGWPGEPGRRWTGGLGWRCIAARATVEKGEKGEQGVQGAFSVVMEGVDQGGPMLWFGFLTLI